MAFALIGGVARAQDAPVERPVQFGVMLGGELPAGGFRTGNDAPGGAVGIQLQLPLAARHLALRGDAMYNFFAWGPCVTLASPGGQSGGCPTAPFEHRMSWSVDLVARLNDPRTSWSPYALAGAALYSNTHIANGSLADAGLQVGFGFEVRPSTRAVLFAECRYMQIFPGGVTPITIGVRF